MTTTMIKMVSSNAAITGMATVTKVKSEKNQNYVLVT
jgi:hypothetical protein